ncbi:MAG TPA: extensin family protein, partial [Hyphomicrobiaceae bacterium]|nr:extensin family protein [Hyphomicrobiaceae bacterium]
MVLQRSAKWGPQTTRVAVLLRDLPLDPFLHSLLGSFVGFAVSLVLATSLSVALGLANTPALAQMATTPPDRATPVQPLPASPINDGSAKDGRPKGRMTEGVGRFGVRSQGLPALGLHGTSMPDAPVAPGFGKINQTPAKPGTVQSGGNSPQGAVAKPAPKQPIKKKPITWSTAEIAAAQRTCRKILKQHPSITRAAQPIRDGNCGSPAPVLLIQLGKNPVTFSPPPIVNCRMVGAIAKWLETGLQPLALKHLGARITDIKVMSSYSCRRAYGRRRARLSEHARANALDIRSFVTADGAETELLAHWGPTQRDAHKRIVTRGGAGTSPEPSVKSTVSPKRSGS